MATDRWEQSWKLHKDKAGILAGIKDREFRLRLIGTIGSNKIYDLIYERELENADPFADTRFFLFGGKDIAAPNAPLEKWQDIDSVEKKYQELIVASCANPSAHTFRLYGEKVVDGVKELLTLFLIPDANLMDRNGVTTVVDLIHVACRTKSPFSFIDSDRPDPARQDGTAHGNPK